MLVGLAIRDVVLIDRLSLSFDQGLCAFTGETGAGKSILLDALGLALGGRGDSGLVRHGADAATVIAEFTVPDEHPARLLLRETDVAVEPEAGEPILIRRVMGADGRSRASINDQPVSVGLLRQVGERLVEIHGQFDSRGLLNPQTHRDVLDSFAGLTVARQQVAMTWRAWRQAGQALTTAREESARAREEEVFLRHAVDELTALDPVPGQESQMAERRTMLMHREKLVETTAAALDALGGEHGVERGLGAAARHLERLRDKAAGQLDAPLAALDRAAAEAEDAIGLLQRLGTDIDIDTGELEALEERLFALRAVARKHAVDVDGLADLRDRLSARLALVAEQDENLAALAKQEIQARQAYQDAAAELTNGRQQAAITLDTAVARELPPLKLEKARFATLVDPCGESDWGPAGVDRVMFAVTTNPGVPPGPLNKIASGGELARFMLALKVVLTDSRMAETGTAPTLVFDEVDSGISGAVADAVGERLAALGTRSQVLAVTHSPQVAARAAHHWRVEKRSPDPSRSDGSGPEGSGEDRMVTSVVPLDAPHRREEIARMLSGAHITDQARAAADSLIATREPL